jgi:hypothetical protein
VKRILENSFKLPSKKVRGLTVSEWRGIIQNFGEGVVADHQKLVAMFATLGPFRPGAAGVLTVTYSVRHGKVVFGENSQVRVVRGDPRHAGPYILVTSTVDKNIRANGKREVPYPARCMGMDTVEFFEWYLLTHRPPSGGFLLAAPHGKGWRKTRYSGAGKALLKAYARAFPGSGPQKLGASSWRKSFPQWLERSGGTDTEVTDICGWSRKGLKGRVGTKAAYTITELDMQLRIKAGLSSKLRKEQARRGV